MIFVVIEEITGFLGRHLKCINIINTHLEFFKKMFYNRKNTSKV